MRVALYRRQTLHTARERWMIVSGSSMSEAEYWESLLGRGAGDPDIYGYPDEDKIVLGS